MLTRAFDMFVQEQRVQRSTIRGYRWRSDVNSYPGLDGQTEFGPTYVYEYSTRAAYGANIPWGADEPLNATWWHLVTERGFPSSSSISPLRPNSMFPLPEMTSNQSLVAVREFSCLESSLLIG